MKRTVVYGGRDVIAMSERTQGGWSWSYTIDGSHHSARLGPLPDESAALDNAVDCAMDKIDAWGGIAHHSDWT